MNKGLLYFNMVFGIIGLLLVVLSALHFIEIGDQTGYLMVFFGLVFIIWYVTFLEKNVNMSKTLYWARTIVTIVLAVAFGYFLYL